ncbi:hypothetical protein BV898_13306 [Hypsibius exemplaris]|uniref:Uncharacterized protein n=1 Tax=Hypsibius exemplaris TaxID=2072580 RepID=A0A1W0WB77_HYPEX|nr:hypothetical protein BV898_13306 [Hypsibius exemplaris]
MLSDEPFLEWDQRYRNAERAQRPMTIRNWFIRQPDMLDMSLPTREYCEVVGLLAWPFPDEQLERLQRFAPTVSSKSRVRVLE